MTCHCTRHGSRAAHPSTALTLAALCLSVVVALPAAAVERMAVNDIRPLLMRAAAQGAAHGVLTGAGTAYLQRRFDTSSPVEIDVQRLHVLPQRGCGRLEVTTRQSAVLIQGKREPRELIYQVSFCADGRFPEER